MTDDGIHRNETGLVSAALAVAYSVLNSGSFVRTQSSLEYVMHECSILAGVIQSRPYACVSQYRAIMLLCNTGNAET